jgi:hypothetical protein
MIKPWQVIIFVGVVLLLRVFIAIFLPLGNDEVYYLLYARYPDIHYYDHPLLVGWFLKLFSFDFFWENSLAYRMFALVLSLPTLYFIYQTTKILSNKNAATIAVVLISSSFYVSVIAGIFAMPDAPMVFFWTSSLYCAANAFFNNSNTQTVNERYFLLLCFLLGLICLSKFHGVFLVLGIFGFILFYRINFIKTASFWEGILILILFSLPILYWNYKNHWVQFAFYTARLPENSSINVMRLLKEMVGELFYTNPVVYLFILYFGVIRFNKIERVNKKSFLLWTSLPFLLFVFGLSLFKETLPHWSGPSFISLVILSSIVADEVANKWAIKAWLNTSFFFFLFCCISAFILINFYPGTLGNKSKQSSYGSADFTLDMYGWDKIDDDVQSSLSELGYRHLPIISDNWFPAAHIDQYISRPMNATFFVLGDVEKIHQYQWINESRGGWGNSDSAILIMPSNYYKDPQTLFNQTFKYHQKLQSIPQYRNNELARYFHIYLYYGRIQREKGNQ